MAKVQFQPRASTDFIMLHCSATKPSMNIGVREIRQWHKEMGWLDVGYHFIIKRDGTVEEGRPQNVIGSHVKGYNHNSVGVCCVGGIDDSGKFQSNFTEAQNASLKSLVAKLREDYPKASVHGHHDFAAKACPSFAVQHWLKTGEMVTSDKA